MTVKEQSRCFLSVRLERKRGLIGIAAVVNDLTEMKFVLSLLLVVGLALKIEGYNTGTHHTIDGVFSAVTSDGDLTSWGHENTATPSWVKT